MIDNILFVQLLLILCVTKVTNVCHGLPVHAVVNLPTKRPVRDRGTTSVHKLLSFLDISRLEREEQERGGFWKSLEDTEDRHDSIEEAPLDDDDDLMLCRDHFSREQDDHNHHCNGSSRDRIKDGKEIKEHPLRTDEWLLHVTLSPFLLPGNRESELLPDLTTFLQGNYDSDGWESVAKSSKTSSGTINKKRKRQVIRFAKNGYVMIVEDPSNDCCVGEDIAYDTGMDSKGVFLSNPVVRRVGGWLENHTLKSWYKCREYNMSHSTGTSYAAESSSNRITKIGKWKMDTSGVSWSIPVTYKVKASNRSSEKSFTVAKTTLHYHADIHLSKFQDHPRMFRGVITRDHFHGFTVPGMNIRKDLFRPVIATFTAEGIGRDTVDISYKKRGFGLNGNA
mmetsp:Transcript_4288/g.8209  ORF Transcript_4288/g.8209 Transcript_4288/m.8209 type:complete len:394 (-) Transcript_4288:137-1318(-)